MNKSSEEPRGELTEDGSFLRFPDLILNSGSNQVENCKIWWGKFKPPKSTVYPVETWDVAYSYREEFLGQDSTLWFSEHCRFPGAFLRDKGQFEFCSSFVPSHPAWLWTPALCKERVQSDIQLHLAFTLPPFAAGVAHASSSSSWWAHLAQCVNRLSLLFSSCFP